MEKYLKLFKNQAEYEAATKKPTVSHMVEDVDVIMPVSYANQYLTFEAVTSGSIKKVWDGGVFYCSLDNGSTWQLMEDGVAFNLGVGQKMLCKNSAEPGSSGIGGGFSASCEVMIYGNIMSMLYGDDFKGKISLEGKNKAFRNIFTFLKNKVISIENVILPATTLSQYCYESLFSGMSRIRKAPVLPATDMEEGCYQFMFNACTSLVEVPELPATELDKWCYSEMFQGCNSLTATVPMTINFCNTQSCHGMYKNCKYLVDASNITINYGETSAYEGYGNMFSSCPRLKKTPNLAATTVTGTQCYSCMFMNCTSLTEAPELPATTLGPQCYGNMFEGCTSLEVAPELTAATTLARYCFYQMFFDCTNLKYIKMTATNVSAENCLQYWVKGVASSGTFVKNSSTSIPSGESGIPNGWTVENM